jgi:hypothetical protein
MYTIETINETQKSTFARIAIVFSFASVVGSGSTSALLGCFLFQDILHILQSSCSPSFKRRAYGLCLSRMVGSWKHPIRHFCKLLHLLILVLFDPLGGGAKSPMTYLGLRLTQ